MNYSLMKICLPRIDNPRQEIQKKQQIETGDFGQKLQQIEQAGFRYEYEERAGILQYDGGLGRDEAERIAVDEILTSFINDKE